ncbi:NAD(P)-dependent oxidoreductase [Alkalicoccus halolimnae]|uniref:NAD(P)H-binding protein n=1 Tax=Alkalicoccus halolimnae TaxID=1667239 RepID=A0A5C7F781_9BACI|nr:NAD(P)H-binding protein [Alkalicoccus halolimnae]TXF86561.1 NAD-dependent epimerase/dehydratase family protein [Alkalicoccus halolimnae]
MKIALFGSTGRVGRIFTERALAEGHHITALIRNQKNLPLSIQNDRNFTFITGDAKNEEDIKKIIHDDTDLVFSALSTDKTDTLSKGVPLIIKEMKKKNITRLVTIGTAGILQARSQPETLRYKAKESKRKMTAAAEEHEAVYSLLEKSGLEWTIFCPTYLPEGPAGGEIASEIDYLPEEGTQISTGNTAFFAYENLLNKAFYRKRVGIVEKG